MKKFNRSKYICERIIKEELTINQAVERFCMSADAVRSLMMKHSTRKEHDRMVADTHWCKTFLSQLNDSLEKNYPQDKRFANSKIKLFFNKSED